MPHAQLDASRCKQHFNAESLADTYGISPSAIAGGVSMMPLPHSLLRPFLRHATISPKVRMTAVGRYLIQSTPRRAIADYARSRAPRRDTHAALT